MNPTIVKIIDLMFRGIPENEETSAMREELLTNSQARYEDLIASGVSPDDALGQVLDNLRGMEDLLDDYRSGRQPGSRSSEKEDSFRFARFERMAEEIDDRFERIADKAESVAKSAYSSAMEGIRSAMDSIGGVFSGPEAAGETVTDRAYASAAGTVGSLWQANDRWGDDDDDILTATFQPSEVNRINVQLVGEDIEADPSPDGLIHVEISKADEPLYQLEVSGGCLSLRRRAWREEAAVQTEEPTEELEGFGGILSGIGKALRGVFQIHRTSGDTVRLLLPNGLEQVTLQTAGGDIDLSGLNAKSLAAATASGDIDMAGCSITGMARLGSTSGDVDVTGSVFADTLSLNSTSGDLDFNGVALHINANNVSGDTDLTGDMRQIRTNAVSGDICITPEKVFESVQANTTSGDIDLTVPPEVTPSVQTNTTSGSVCVSCPTAAESAVTIRLNSVSGDLAVRNF